MVARWAIRGCARHRGCVVVAWTASACGSSEKNPPPIAGETDGETATESPETLDPCALAGDSGDGDGDGDGEGVKFDVAAGEGQFEFPKSCAEVEGTQTNLGCEFWAVDLPNEWRGTPNSPPAAEQQFAVVVANASSLDEVAVEVFVGNGQEPIAAAVVPVDSTHEFQLAPLNIDPEANSQDGLAFRVVSDRPITAYQFNPLDNQIEVYSNDASLLMPAHALGEAYAAVTGTGILLSMDQEDPDPAPAGAFISVVATLDDTEVAIFPTGEVLPGPLEGVKVDRGEVFTVLSDASVYGTNLSGSQIRADGTVAVFSGNVATVVPIDALACCADHIEQQMMPSDALGHAYAIAPMASPAGLDVDDPGVYRITGAFDETYLRYCPHKPDGAPWSIHARQSAVFESDFPFTVISVGDQQPFSVTAFLESNQAIAGESGQAGDPAMIVLPPTDQFQHKYVFAIPKGYGHNHVTVIGRQGDWEFDGEPIDEASKRELGVSEGRMLMFVRIAATEGSHVVEASVPVGVLVSGLDTAVSYGFPGGVGLDEIAPVPPVG
jgi:hypothetical protein